MSPCDKPLIFKRLAFLLLGVVLTSVIGCQFRSEHRVPPYLLGKWQTDSPRYKGLNFEVTENNLVFKTVEGRLNSFVISGLESSAQGETIATVFYGRQDDLQINVAVFYEPTNGGQIRFRNQLNTIWRRVANA